MSYDGTKMIRQCFGCHLPFIGEPEDALCWPCSTMLTLWQQGPKETHHPMGPPIQFLLGLGILLPCPAMRPLPDWALAEGELLVD